MIGRRHRCGRQHCEGLPRHVSGWLLPDSESSRSAVDSPETPVLHQSRGGCWGWLLGVGGGGVSLLQAFTHVVSIHRNAFVTKDGL